MMAYMDTKTVTVHRGPSGFGITLSGQHPCILSSVHEASEAFEVGLRRGDRLLRVNGVAVDKAAHDEVVSLIAHSGLVLNLCIASGLGPMRGGASLDVPSSSDEDHDFIQSRAHFIVEQIHNKRLAGELVEGTTTSTNNSSAELVNILFSRNGRPSYAANQHHRAAFGLSTVESNGTVGWQQAGLPPPPLPPAAVQAAHSHVRAVLSYLGSVSSSSSEEWAQSLLGKAIVQLRDQQRVLVAMQVTGDALVLSNHRGTPVARFTKDCILFYGMDESSPSYFGVVTRQSAQNLSAHVFVADPRLVPHTSHARRARTFKIACQRDPRTNTCKEFPLTAQPILMALAKIRACPTAIHAGPPAPQPGPRHIYDSDSGFRDDSLERSVNSGHQARQHLNGDSLEDVSSKLRDLILLEKSPSKASESQVSLDSLDVVPHYKHSPKVYSLRKQHSLDALDTPRYNDGAAGARVGAENYPAIAQHRRQQSGLSAQEPLQSLPTSVASWSESLDSVLNHPEGILIFAKFLKKEFAQENIFFWTACEQYRNEKSQTQRKLKAREIFDKHLKDDCAEPLNIDGSTLRDIVTRLEAGHAPKDLFAVAQDHIYNLMRMDCYPRFLKSDLYQQCLIKEVNGEPLLASPVKSETGDAGGSLADRRNNPGFASHPDLNGINHRTGNVSNSSASSVSTSGGSIAKARRSLFPNVKKLGKKKKDDEKKDTALASAATPDDKHLIIVIPSGEAKKIAVTGSETLAQIISEVLQKNTTSSGTSLVDVFAAQSQQPVDLGTPVSQLLRETITIEPRVAFLLALPSGTILGLKCAPLSTLRGVVQGVCLRYNLDASQMACRLHNATKLLDPMTACGQLDGARLVLTSKNQRPEWHLTGQLGAGQASPWYAKGQDIQAFLALVQTGAVVFDETGIALFSTGGPPLPPKPSKFQKSQKGLHPLENTCNISFV